MNINKLNLLNERNICKMKYEPNPSNRRVDVYFTFDDEVIILGVIDNNYIFWQSITSIMDKETNELIFNYITSSEYKIISNIHNTLLNKGMSYEEFKELYSISLIKGRYADVAWETPFGHYYSIDQVKNNGKYFAHDISLLPDRIRRKCEIRNIGNIYKDVIKKYLEILGEDNADPVQAYNSTKPIIDIIESENYLKILTCIERLTNI